MTRASNRTTWAVSRIDRVATVNARIGWKALTANEYQPEGYVFLATPNIKSQAIDFQNVNYISRFRYEESPELQLRVGDVLLAKDGSTLGIANVVRELPRPATVNGSIAVLRPYGINDRYLTYALRSAATQEWIEQVKDGMGVPHLFQADIKKMSIPLPPPEIQHQIADFLDDQISRIDEITTARAQQARLIKEQFVAQLERLYHSCDAVRLNYLVPPGRPINYGVLMPGPHYPGGIALIEAGDLARGPLVEESLRRTDPAIEKEFRRSRLMPGDLVMAIRGSVGSVRVVPSSLVGANVTRDAARIAVCPSRARPGFVRYALMAPRTQSWLELRLLGSAVRGINIGDLRQLPIPLLGLSEQDRYERELAALESEQARLSEVLLTSNRLLGELKRSLITDAVTGEFDVTSADASRIPA